MAQSAVRAAMAAVRQASERRKRKVENAVRRQVPQPRAAMLSAVTMPVSSDHVSIIEATRAPVRSRSGILPSPEPPETRCASDISRVRRIRRGIAPSAIESRSAVFGDSRPKM